MANLNERITEELFLNLFRDKNNEEIKNNDIKIESQISKIKKINDLLANASKKENGNKGFPEFIITNNEDFKFVIVVECKADTNKHETNERNKPIEYAVDGVLHYAKFLKDEYNVIAIAISGDETFHKIDTFYIEQGSDEILPLVDRQSMNVKNILSFKEYIDLSIYDKENEDKKHKDLLGFSKELHQFMWDYAKLTEEQKPLLVSGTLIALKDNTFKNIYDQYPTEQLPDQWLISIKNALDNSNIPKDKVEKMLIPYKHISNHPELKKVNDKFPMGILNEMISMIKKNIFPLINEHNGLDVMGQFYGEFLKYTSGDGKGLGIVLTPKHITDLFCELVDLKENDKVLDLCTGTGGFLISSMNYMIKKATIKYKDQEERIQKINEIKSNNLVGVEQQPNMFALAASNMILRGDGKSNLYQGSCFDPNIVKSLKEHKCNIGFINPPYSQKDYSELHFIDHMLDCLSVGGIGVAIIPMSCAISSSYKTIKEKILKKHTLKAVMSMPENLFYPVGVVSCIMVFEANNPHSDEEESYFGYWKDDGYKILKHQGRKDVHGVWKDIKKEWVKSYKKTTIQAGFSASSIVNHTDEWCAEAYLETDFSFIHQNHHINAMKNYLAYKFINNIKCNEITSEKFNEEDVQLPKIEDWQEYLYEDIFNVVNPKNKTKDDNDSCFTPYIGASMNNNGVTEIIKAKPEFLRNKITIGSNGQTGVGQTFYQPTNFSANTTVNVLDLKNKTLNPYIAMFLIPFFKAERFKYNFGRGWGLDRMKKTKIKLPSIIDENGKHQPNWDLMEKYIKSLPYSKNI